MQRNERRRREKEKIDSVVWKCARRDDDWREKSKKKLGKDQVRH